MARTLQEQLDALDALIEKIEALEGTAEWQDGGQRYRMQDLPMLYLRRDLLQARVDQTNSGGMSVIGFVDT